MYNSISDYIPTERQNAIKGKELCNMLNLNEREMRQLIEKERLNGVPIVADNCGYWITDDPAEIEHYCRKVSVVIRSYKRILVAIRSRGGI